jgi:hypothetical protein
VPQDLVLPTNAVFGEKIMIGIGVNGGKRVVGLEEVATRQQAALVIFRCMQWLGLV